MDRILNVRHRLKYDTYINWMTNNPTLLAGEVAIATFPQDDTSGESTTLPAILFKVGDGTHSYSDLPFVSAKAADVHSWAKMTEDEMKAWILENTSSEYQDKLTYKQIAVGFDLDTTNTTELWSDDTVAVKYDYVELSNGNNDHYILPLCTDQIGEREISPTETLNPYYWYATIIENGSIIWAKQDKETATWTGGVIKPVDESQLETKQDKLTYKSFSVWFQTDRTNTSDIWSDDTEAIKYDYVVLNNGGPIDYTLPFCADQMIQSMVSPTETIDPFYFYATIIENGSVMWVKQDKETAAWTGGVIKSNNSDNIKDGSGVGSLQQSFDTETWSPMNQQIIEAINSNLGTADDGYTINVDETGNAVVGAFGKHSIMTGGKSQNVGKKSFTAGSKNIAFENNSAAFGNETFAKGKHSFAQGNRTTASGNAAMAIGQETEASGAQSFAGGLWTQAKGDYSAVLGLGTVAGGNEQFVHGRYNVEDNGEYAHIVGNGWVDRDESGNITEVYPRNAYTLDWNGNAWFAGDVTIGDNKDRLVTENAVSVAIAEAVANVDHLKRVIVDELPSGNDIDPNTIYMIATKEYGPNMYVEYFFIEGMGFEIIGDSSIDLNGYYTSKQVDKKFEDIEPATHLISRSESVKTGTTHAYTIVRQSDGNTIYVSNAEHNHSIHDIWVSLDENGNFVEGGSPTNGLSYYLNNILLGQGQGNTLILDCGDSNF